MWSHELTFISAESSAGDAKCALKEPFSRGSRLKGDTDNISTSPFVGVALASASLFCSVGR